MSEPGRAIDRSATALPGAPDAVTSKEPTP